MFSFLSIPFWGNEEKTEFPLPQLPENAITNVVTQMDLLEHISLSVLSKKMNECVKTSAATEDHFEVNFTDESAVIEIPDKLKISKSEIIDWNKKESSWFFNPFASTKTFISKTIELVDQIQATFPKITFSLTLHSSDLKDQDVMDALKNKTWKKVNIIGGELKTEDLDKIMEMDNSEKAFAFKNIIFPLGYKHVNALKFASIEYEDATWIQIDDLLAVQHKPSIILGSTNFKSEELNLLLKKWQSSEHDMFKFFKCCNNELDMEKVLDGSVTLNIDWKLKHLSYNFLGAENIGNRNLPCLQVSAFGHTIQLLPFADYEELEEPRIIKNLMQKKKLEDELAGKDENVAQEITAKLQEVLSSLEKDQVYFINGKAQRNSSKIAAVALINAYFHKRKVGEKK
ncbi:hypothetical protein CRE_28874 [Caenorhabditis remanei]|uniref:F-box domain-containing protein n=1 Tax=Caenorhabditis remanei TaxID=31234 RepID=E3MXB1_CAERE|nr:hypothetical protein CRE_28874 [Caenorhabditis remanei]